MFMLRHRVPVTALLVAVAVGSTAILTPSVAARPASPSSAGTAIAYTYQAEWGNYEYSVVIDGLPDGLAWLDYGIQPAWSTDGSRVAYADEFGYGIFVADLRDGSRRQITTLGWTPAWSPDASRIAFAAGELYVIGSDGSGLVQLTQNLGFTESPAWSPDGLTIVFDCEIGGMRDLCAIRPDGSGLTQLTADASGAAFSPDGTQIAFSKGSQIALMNTDGSGITLTGITGVSPAWSPDGSQLAYVVPFTGFCTWVVCPDSVRVSNLDGSGTMVVGGGSEPAWATLGLPVAAPYSSGCDGLTCAFDGSWSLADAAGIAAYAWAFGDGGTASGAVASHTYAAPGTYLVSLTVTDSAGVSGTTYLSVDVRVNQWPVASFTFSCTNLSCAFNSSASSDPDGQIVNRVWDFGDGTTDTGTIVDHTYAAAGMWTVTLVVTDDMGASASATSAVSVTAPPPPNPIHVGDLDGSSSTLKNTWTALVTVTVHDSSHGPVANAVVTGAWDAGSVTCTTNAAGQCTLTRAGLSKRTSFASFTVSGVAHPIGPYQPAANHDPDGDSNGSVIKISKP